MTSKLILHLEDKKVVLSDFFTLNNGDIFSVSDINISVYKEKKDDNITLYELKASGKGKVYFDIYGKTTGDIFSFNGTYEEEHVLRQSPHNPYEYGLKMDGTAIPLIASCEEETVIFVSDRPSHVDNYTVQHILPKTHEFYFSSGDLGTSPNFENVKVSFQPYYHDLSVKDHVFRFITIKSKSKTLKSIRKDAFISINKIWGYGDDSLYHSICYGANYMHIRKNETGTSDYWIVPGIEYPNAQYVRDAFYQTYILKPEDSEQCYKSINYDFMKNAEYPLFYLIWSYRVFKNGGHINKEVCDGAFKIVVECLNKVNDGRYCPNGLEDGSYRNWFDICCYEYDDCDSYSQSLCICALRCAKELGYDTKDYYERAIKFYLNMFNGKIMPMSLKKPYQAVDFALGDLLHFFLFNESFLPDKLVNITYNHIMSSEANTKYGVKIVSNLDGSYLPLEAFGAYGKVNPLMANVKLGYYANGGSYHVYEMLFHIEAHIHHNENALDNMIKRLMIDLDYDGTTHEYMNTIKGNGVKANQGWNACIYAIWKKLCDIGVGDRKYFEEADKKMNELT